MRRVVGEDQPQCFASPPQVMERQGEEGSCGSAQAFIRLHALEQSAGFVELADVAKSAGELDGGIPLSLGVQTDSHRPAVERDGLMLLAEHVVQRGALEIGCRVALGASGEQQFQSRPRHLRLSIVGVCPETLEPLLPRPIRAINLVLAHEDGAYCRHKFDRASLRRGAPITAREAVDRRAQRRSRTVLTVSEEAEAGRERVRRVMGLQPGHRVVKVPNEGAPALILLDLASLRRDFEMAHQFISTFARLPRSEVEPDSPHQALWIAAVTMYGRAFSTTGLRHSARASAELYDADDRSAHDYLIAMRNKYIAHSVNAFEQAVVLAIISGETGEKLSVEGVGTQHASLARLSRARALQMARMCKSQMEDIDSRIADAQTAVETELSERGTEFLMGLEELGMVSVDETAVNRSRSPRT